MSIYYGHYYSHILMTYLKDAAIGSELRNSSGSLIMDFWIPVYIISCVTHLIESHGEMLSLCDLMKIVPAEFKQNTTASLCK